jgi:hypothetical protein
MNGMVLYSNNCAFERRFFGGQHDQSVNNSAQPAHRSAIAPCGAARQASPRLTSLNAR